VSDSQNPYKAPESTEPTPAAAAVGGVTPKTRELLGKAAPWLKFLTVINYIFLGILVVFGAIVVIGGLFSATLSQSLGGAGPILALVYVALAVVLFIPARVLGKLAKASKKYKALGDAADLEAAAGAIRFLAKYFGIFTIVVLSLYVVVLIGAAVFAATLFH
jgi:hypothetical protein